MMSTATTRERPILFSSPMVRAILDGRKTQTRRIVKPGRSQDWFTSETMDAVRRWEHRKDSWWSAQVGEPHRIQHCGVDMDGGHIGCVRCPYGATGDRLYVKETWGYKSFEDAQGKAVTYRADTDGARQHTTMRWRPCIHMPRWASRIDLEVTSVRAERVRDIGKDGRKAHDVLAEGITRDEIDHMQKFFHPDDSPAIAYAVLWDSINGKGSWAANPWVWAVTFKVIRPEVPHA